MANKMLDSFVRGVKKSHGDRMIGSAETQALPDIRITTGSFDLDVGLGGGLGIGKIVELYGDKSSGKTTTALRIISVAQGLCRNCYRVASFLEAVPPEEAEDERWSATGHCDCYSVGRWKPDEVVREDKEPAKKYKERVEARHLALTENSYGEFVAAFLDQEGAFDKKWATKVGVDIRRLLLVQSETAEEAIDITDGLIRTNEVDLLVIDSIAQFLPTKEIEASAMDWQQGLQARLVNKAVRKWVGARTAYRRATGRWQTQIWINQTRKAIGQAYGDPTVLPSGEGQKFAADAMVKMWSSEAKVEDRMLNNEKKETYSIPQKIRINFKIAKNKTAPPLSEGSYWQAWIDLEEGKAGAVLDFDLIWKHTLHFVVTKTKDTYKIGDEEYTSQDSIKKKMREDPGFYRAMRDACFRARLSDLSVVPDAP